MQNFDSQCVEGVRSRNSFATMQGWMVNSKLKYKNAMGPSTELLDNESKERKSIMRMVHHERKKLASTNHEHRGQVDEI